MRAFFHSLLAIALGQTLACDCDGHACFVGGRIYWSHEGINAQLFTWVQAAFISESNGGAPAPVRIDLECSGEFVGGGVVETTTKVATLISFNIPGLGVYESDLLDYPDVETPLGRVSLKWGQGVLTSVEVGSWFQCCWSGEARYTPLQNADDCAPYNLCVDVDLRTTNGGPRPRGYGDQDGTIDMLFRDGFVITPMCIRNEIDLETLYSPLEGSVSYSIDHTNNPGSNEVASFDGISPEIDDDGILLWNLGPDDVEMPSDGLSLNSYYSINVIVRQKPSDFDDLHLNGTMDVDFIAAIDPGSPVCSVLALSDVYVIGEQFSVSFSVEDVSPENPLWKNNEDVISVSHLRGSGIFVSKPEIPTQIPSSRPVILNATVTCPEDEGDFDIGIFVSDNCGHTTTCVFGYKCQGDDTDECTEQTHDCHEHATCTNKPMTYLCECNEGFVGDGRICEDIDECTDETHDCNANASCTNAIGGFHCECNEWFEGDGKSCLRRSCQSVDVCSCNVENCGSDWGWCGSSHKCGSGCSTNLEEFAEGGCEDSADDIEERISAIEVKLDKLITKLIEAGVIESLE